jgi:hypothetical protein
MFGVQSDVKINDWNPKSRSSISYLQNEIKRSNFKFWDQLTANNQNLILSIKQNIKSKTDV